MSRSPFVSVGDLCATPSQALSQLIGHAQALERLDRVLRARLEAPLAEHCRLANITGHTLHLEADSSAWATRVRYSAEAILAGLRHCGEMPGVHRIAVHVRPPAASRTTRAPAPALRIPAEAAALLKSVAESTDNPRLARTLIRLAERAG